MNNFSTHKHVEMRDWVAANMSSVFTIPTVARGWALGRGVFWRHRPTGHQLCEWLEPVKTAPLFAPFANLWNDR